jgi:hypothetical protein
MTLGYPPEQKGQINVTATKEEWQAVIDELLRFREPKGAPADLIHWLINQGVYE